VEDDQTQAVGGVDRSCVLSVRLARPSEIPIELLALKRHCNVQAFLQMARAWDLARAAGVHALLLEIDGVVRGASIIFEDYVKSSVMCDSIIVDESARTGDTVARFIRASSDFCDMLARERGLSRVVASMPEGVARKVLGEIGREYSEVERVYAYDVEVSAWDG
jgi:hypothetical protein